MPSDPVLRDNDSTRFRRHRTLGLKDRLRGCGFRDIVWIRIICPKIYPRINAPWRKGELERRMGTNI